MKHLVFDDFFAVLGSQQRVRILQYLDQEEAKSVTDISAVLGLEQSAVSHNMKRLLDCHFVEMTPDGKRRLYTINRQTVAPLFKLIDQHVREFCAKGCSHWE